MWGREPKTKEGEDDRLVTFEGERPHPNLLDYRYMDIFMGMWARTDSGCASILAMLLLAFACVLAFVACASLRGY